MLTIGDLTGLATTINVSEININRIKVGAPVKITGDAFPGITLDGKVVTVSSQANPGTGDQASISLFAVQIKVPSITEKQRQTIKVGMTAKVEIDIKKPPQILLPINAVTQREQKTYVTVIDKDGKHKQVEVTTGETTTTDVTILKGLSVGDRVVVND
mgnify:CR=1 FL=1